LIDEHHPDPQILDLNPDFPTFAVREHQLPNNVGKLGFQIVPKISNF
jgi:hypothetical protein